MNSSSLYPYFPNLAWGFSTNRWDTSLSNPDVLKGMKDCGINQAGFILPADLDKVHDAGLQAYVYDPRCYQYYFHDLDDDKLRENAHSLAAEVGGHPALAGYCVKDEPHASEFPGLAKVAAAFREADPKHPVYINLFPNYATPGQLGTETYDEYVRSYIEIVKPQFVSYDHYALFEHDPLRPSYFANLEVISRLSAEYRLPFWNIVLANAHFTYAEPSPAGMRFQLFTTLAYGGKGISWFTYIAPEVGNYRLAPIDQFGMRTPTWEHLQNVSLQLEQLTPTLLHLVSQRVYHFGEIPDGCRPAPAGAWVRTVHGLHQQFLAGEFIHTQDESQWLILVNKDLRHSTNFNLELVEPASKVEMVSLFNGQLLPLAGENNWLAPGQGVVLKISI